MQIIQPPQQPLEIADAVAIGIHIGANRQTIEDGILVPKVVDHAQAALIGPPSVLSGRLISDAQAALIGPPSVLSGRLISDKGFVGSRR